MRPERGVPRSLGMARDDPGDAGRKLFERTREKVLARPLPVSTYRLQFHRGFRFDAATRVLPYLRRLGVTDVYASPYLQAAPGSTHGYDIVDHDKLNSEIGTAAEHSTFCETARELGLGQVLDVVANHMGIGPHNRPWFDVLENGPASVFAKFFDIDWDPVKEELKDKVLLPVLGDQYGAILESGQLKLCFEDGAFLVRYYEHVFPVAPQQYAPILRLGLEPLEAQLGTRDADFIELQSILTAIEHLPGPRSVDPGRRIERNREKTVIRNRLATLCARRLDLRQHIENNVRNLNGRPGEPATFDRLHAVLEGCSYRLAHWRVAAEEINYRRFFDINSLGAIRVEDPEVFDETHARIFEWIREGKVTGLRIDHPDGLFDPTAYFLRLQERHFLEQARVVLEEELSGSGFNWGELEPEARRHFLAEIEADPDGPLRRGIYVVVEKIQGGRERIPDAWAVHGTVGYRFANAVTGLFVSRENEKALTEIYERFIGRKVDFPELVYDKKKLVLVTSLASEVNVLARELNRISEMNRRTRDFTLNSLRRALVEFVALFPVYRTYVDDWRPELDDRDVRYIEWTVARAKERDATTNTSIFDFLRDILLRRYTPDLTPDERAVMLRFAMKLQQLTGPAMAKGLEDTVFYIYNRLTSLNEVGGEPERFGTSDHLFHLRNQERAEKWPHSMLSTSTHDTKRGEDVRARINVLTELPREWAETLETWSRAHEAYKTRVGADLAPSRNDEYLFYQTVLGAWPSGERPSRDALFRFRDRLREYMLKAVKEAKVHTSWVNPDPSYEAAVERFVRLSLDPDGNADFLESAFRFKRRLERPGYTNSLGQVLLKLASPGTADFYQGAELWQWSLVDPDNRRAVDFDERDQLLRELDQDAERDRLKLCERLAANLDDGRAKLYLTAQGLRYRRRRKQLFRFGDYHPLVSTGPRARNVFGFARLHQKQALLAIVPRLVVPLLDKGGLAVAFADTWVQVPDELSGATLIDVLSGRAVRPVHIEGRPSLKASELFGPFPVALLDASH